jgi:hypothetical protein
MKVHVHKPTLAQLMAGVNLGDPRAIVIDQDFNGYPAEVVFETNHLDYSIIARVSPPDTNESHYIEAILIVYDNMELLAMVNDIHWLSSFTLEIKVLQ